MFHCSADVSGDSVVCPVQVVLAVCYEINDSTEDLERSTSVVTAKTAFKVQPRYEGGDDGNKILMGRSPSLRAWKKSAYPRRGITTRVPGASSPCI